MNNTQPSKPDPKGKAIASLVLGVISAGALLVMYVFLNKAINDKAILVISLPLAISGLIGLILGKKVFKSPITPLLKNFSTVGIILCAIGFIFWLLIFCFYILMLLVWELIS